MGQSHWLAISPFYCFGFILGFMYAFLHFPCISRLFLCNYKHLHFRVIPENKTQTITYGIFTLMFVLTFSYYPKSFHFAIVKLFTVDWEMCTPIGLKSVKTYPGLKSRVIPTQITGKEWKGICCWNKTRSKYIWLGSLRGIL